MATAMEPSAALPIDQLIIEDHNKVRFLFNEYLKTATVDMKLQLALTIIREVSMHSSKEEEVVYPVIGQLFGEAEMQHCLAQHQEMKVNMTALLNMDPAQDQATFEQMMLLVKTEFEQHIAEEEQQEIPKMLQAMPSKGLDPIDMGLQWMKAAEHAMTKPLPEAPDKPPMNIMANMLASPMMAEEVMTQVREGAPGMETMAPPSGMAS